MQGFVFARPVVYGRLWKPKAVKKYWHVINIGIQNSLAYRVNFLFRILFGFIPLLATIYLWRAIYEGKASVGVYTLAQMTSYYLVVTMVDVLTAVNEDDWQIAADIKDGNISQFLLKPIDYLTYRLCLFCSGRVIYLAVSAVPLSLFIFGMRKYFILPADAACLGWFSVSVVLTALLQFFTSYAMAMLAFWVLEVSTFISSCSRSNTWRADICFRWIFCRRRWNTRWRSRRFPIRCIFRRAFTWQNHRGRALAGPDDTGRVGGRGLRHRAAGVAPGIRKYSAVGG